MYDTTWRACPSVILACPAAPADIFRAKLRCSMGRGKLPRASLKHKFNQ